MNRLRRPLLLCLALILLPLQGFAAARMPWQIAVPPSGLSAVAETEAPSHACHDMAQAADDSVPGEKSAPAHQHTASPHCGGCCLATALVPMFPHAPHAMMHLLYRIDESTLPGAGIDPDTPHKPPRDFLA